MKIENSSYFLVLIWEKDRNSNIPENVPILAIGNSREILLLCQKILFPKSSLIEFFQYYKSMGEKVGYHLDNSDITNFLKLLEKLKIIEIFELPKEIFKD